MLAYGVGLGLGCLVMVGIFFIGVLLGLVSLVAGPEAATVVAVGLPVWILLKVRRRWRRRRDGSMG